MRTRSIILGCVALTLLLTAGAAQSLSGSNTVFTDDIADGQVRYPDIRDGAVTGKKILDDSVTGADVKESTIPGFKRVYFARVMFVYADGTESGPKGARLYGGNATSATINEATLEYKVTFPVNVATCASTVTSGTVPGLVPPEAAINPQSRPVASTRIAAANPNDVFVTFMQATNASADNFSLVLVCP
jgi:hypothetical protein